MSEIPDLLRLLEALTPPKRNPCDPRRMDANEIAISERAYQEWYERDLQEMNLRKRDTLALTIEQRAAAGRLQP